MRFFTRLRYQLILSHFLAIAFTLLSMVAALVFVAAGWLTSQQDQLIGPAADARTVASAVGGMVQAGQPAAELDPVLRAMASGALRVGSVPFAPTVGSSATTRARWPYWSGAAALQDVAYVVVVGPNGATLASSEPAGAGFDPPEAGEWQTVARAALANRPDPSSLLLERPGQQPAALGAYPIADAAGNPVAAVVVASSVPIQGQGLVGLGRFLPFVGAASLGILALASLFALIPASVVGYALSRGLVVRLESLGRATEALAAGDLSGRVEEGRPDEVGQLARRFNYMAAKLAATVAELEAAKEATEATLRAKRELVVNVSHELRTPVALIRGHVESLLLRGQDDDSEAQRGLAVIQRETERLGQLIEDLFALSTAEAGALPLDVEPVQLGEVVEEVVGAVQPIARREHQIAVVAQVAPDLPPALVDRRRVVQVLGNLVRNALRYTPEGGLVAVRAERQDGQVAITVEDTGEGILPERLPHVFERFYRGDGARDRASGAGLGLAIVRELVEAMGGSVAVESVLGQGSRFTFRLPAARATVDEGKEISPASRP